MAKQLNVNLAFTADTSQARAQLQQLQNQLSIIAKSPANLNMPLTNKIMEASEAAIQLKMHLQAATNVNTGTLDFTKLSTSLKKSGTDLVSYGSKLKALGPQGQ